MAKSQFPYRQNGSEEPLPRESPKADDEGKPQGANRWTIGRLRVGEHVGCRLMPGAKQHPNKPHFLCCGESSQFQGTTSSTVFNGLQEASDAGYAKSD